MTLEKEEIIEIVENAISWIVVLAMLLYGVGKFFQFDGAAQINKTVAQMTGMELMWAFYGYSKPFALTIGFLEVTGGILIFFKKTRIIGCLLTSTVLVNVILQDIFYGVNVGALKAAVIYQTLIIIILWFNRSQLIEAFKILVTHEKRTESTRRWGIKLAIAFVLFVVVRILEYLITVKT